MRLHPKGFDLSLGRITALLARLGDPHLNLPPVIHVAGTNGKGSTVAFTRAILEAAGLRVHVDTSPHLVNWHERYRLAGTLVGDEELAATVEEVAAANDGQAITVFEILTAVAFLLFARHPADATLIEVGLGGRFDCTNVMEDVSVSVITPVSMDHEAFLGDTLGKIAFEKAGIIRKTTPVIVGLQQDDALDVIERQAAKMGAPVSVQGQDFSGSADQGRMVWQGEDRLIDLPRPRLFGAHQIDNAATAVAACLAFASRNGVDLSDEAIANGIASADWPARMQRLTGGHLFDHAPAGADIWIDGGHNPAAGVALTEALLALDRRDPRPVHLVCGMLDTKDAAGFLAPLQRVVTSASAVTVRSSDAGLPADGLCRSMRDVGLDAQAAESLPDALMQATNEGPRIIIAGSLYLAGEALAANGTPPC